MAKYAHVKKGLGTRTATETKTAQETGAFGSTGLLAGDVYADLSSVITNAGLVDGDYIIFSDSHAAAYSANTVISSVPSVTMISVSDTSAGTYSAGALENVTSASNYLLLVNAADDIIVSYGVDFTGGNRLEIGGDRGATMIYDATLTTASGYIYVSQNGLLHTEDCTIALGTGYFRSIGCSYSAINCSYTGSNSVIFQSAGGGLTVNARDCDFSALTSTNLTRASASPEDLVIQKFVRCKLPSGITLVQNGSVASEQQKIDFYSCHTADNYWMQKYYRKNGIALDNTTVKRTGGATYDGSTEFSIEFQPSSSAVPYERPLRIAIYHADMDLSSANTLTFHLGFIHSSAVPTINNDDIWIELEQNSNATTSKALGLIITTKPTDILTTPTALTTDSTSTWVNLTGTSTAKKQIAVTTTAVTGLTTGQVTAYLCVGLYDSGLEIYGCPSPTIEPVV